MQRLKGLYAVRFHRRHHTSGHLFKRPYDCRSIATMEHLHGACSYTLRTPRGTPPNTRQGVTSGSRASDPPRDSKRRHPRSHMWQPLDRLLHLGEGTASVDAPTPRSASMRVLARASTDSRRQSRCAGHAAGRPVRLGHDHGSRAGGSRPAARVTRITRTGGSASALDDRESGSAARPG